MSLSLADQHTRLTFDETSGGLTSLVHLPSGVEFAGHAARNPRLARADPPRLGHVRLRTSSWGGPWRLEDMRWTGDTRVVPHPDAARVSVVCPGGGPGDNAIRTVRLEQTWELGRGPAAATWRIRVTHRGDPDDPRALPLRLGELSLPLVFNTHFGGHGDQDLIYDQRVMIHASACGYGGYILVRRLSGAAPLLLLVPTATTPLEALAHDTGEFGAGNGWDGLLSVYCWSRAADELGNWNGWYHGCRDRLLAPGAACEVGFDLYWLADERELTPTLEAAGQLTFRAHPGYVVPVNHPCLLYIGGAAAAAVRAVTVSGGGAATRTAAGPAGATYDLRFAGCGPCDVHVTWGDGRWTNLPFFVTPDARQQLAARARFIAERQFFRRPGHHMDHAFMMWDADAQALVLDAPDTPWLVGGSDEAGLADPLALSAKNVALPDRGEIAVLEAYVDRFLYGVLQRRDDAGIRNWVAPPDCPTRRFGDRTDRSFNYPHVWNIYLHLHRIARAFALTTVRTADEYLELAYRTARAYFTLPMHAEHNITKGNMGEDTLVELADACKAAGHTTWAAELRAHMARKMAHMTRERNPYLSELSFDTTGYPSAYLFRRLAGDDAGAAATLAVIRATRHPCPGWPWYASDVRWGWGNSRRRYGDEICLNYMTSLNALPLLDAFERDGDLDSLRLGYAALLAVWALVEPDGTAHDFYTWEPGRRGFDPWTSEMGLALFPTIRRSAAYVVDDPALGLIGYGCALHTDDDTLSITPLDAVRQRVWIQPQRLELRLSAGAIAAVRLVDGYRHIVVELCPPPHGDTTAKLTLRGGAALYDVTVGRKPSGRMAAGALGAGALSVRLTAPTTTVTLVAAMP